ncbi:MAG: phosphoribosyltransferase family protein [Chloroflexota bacterium]|nr:phosphoribosyltransferase family protein [Chloroflexota bacterium]
MFDRPDNPNRTIVLTWSDVDRLIDILVPQFRVLGGFNTIVLITRGGVIPGGMLAEALDVEHVLTAAVDFPSKAVGLMAWPQFLQFPEDALVSGKRVLAVDDVWGTGRTSIAVRERLTGAKAEAFSCVLHYNPYRSLFKKEKPDFFAETTDAYMIYPWEVDRGMRDMDVFAPEAN